MTTIILTYRNRDLSIVKKCLDSLLVQTSKDFSVVLVDYGSDETFKDELKKCIVNYDFIKLIRCETTRQLWCKSKAINIALKQIDTPYCFVGDVDMIYHPKFIEKLETCKIATLSTYFQVGFLSENESKTNKAFEDYKINFKSNNEATGMTLYDTAVLKSINGYDEFYHGWGSEDTDVHVRLKNTGHNVDFYKDNILILHQWHPKTYRSIESREPFHSQLELINHQYLKKTDSNKLKIANTFFSWGTIPNYIDFTAQKCLKLTITNLSADVDALLYGYLNNYEQQRLVIKIEIHPEYKSLKNTIKKLFGKKHLVFYDLQTINNLILGNIIARFRNRFYEFEWDKKSETIILKIDL